MSVLQQAQQEGFCLHYPDTLPPQREISFENAINTLGKAAEMARNTAFHWRYIDKPQEGQLALLFLPPQTPFPNDGIRYQEPESTTTMNVQGGRELEVSEARSGFIPNSQDQNAWRLRRRYRLLKGGHPNLVLVHYTRGQPNPIAPSVANLPVRHYPLRTISEPPTFVLGEKAGQKLYPPGVPGPGMQQPPMSAGPSVVVPPGGGPGIMPGGPPGMGNMGFNTPAAQAAMINQQAQAMEQLERRRAAERDMSKERAAAVAAQRGPVHGRMPHMNDDGSDDETEQISTRNLALTRYKRNHELMNAVFMQAAFGDKSRPTQPSPYSIFNKDELERKTAQLQADLEALQKRGAERKALRANGGDVSMEGHALTA